MFISTASKCFYGSPAFRTSEQYFDLDERSETVGVDYPTQLVRLWEAATAGVDAVHGLAVLDSRYGPFNLANRLLFKSRRLTRALYSLLRSISNLLNHTTSVGVSSSSQRWSNFS